MRQRRMVRNLVSGEPVLEMGRAEAPISFWQALENLAGSQRGVSHSVACPRAPLLSDRSTALWRAWPLRLETSRVQYLRTAGCLTPQHVATTLRLGTFPSARARATRCGLRQAALQLPRTDLRLLATLLKRVRRCGRFRSRLPSRNAVGT